MSTTTLLVTSVVIGAIAVSTSYVAFESFEHKVSPCGRVLLIQPSFRVLHLDGRVSTQVVQMRGGTAAAGSVIAKRAEISSEAHLTRDLARSGWFDATAAQYSTCSCSLLLHKPKRVAFP